MHGNKLTKKSDIWTIKKVTKQHKKLQCTERNSNIMTKIVTWCLHKSNKMTKKSKIVTIKKVTKQHKKLQHNERKSNRMTKIATCWCLHKSNEITKKSNVGCYPLKKKNNKCELSEQAGNRKHASVQCS